MKPSANLILHGPRSCPRQANRLLSRSNTMAIMIISPELYAELCSVDSNRDGKADRIVTLYETFGGLPEGAYDDYAVRLGDTEIYKSFAALRVLPEDTLICFLEPNWKGSKNSNEKYYNREREIFRAIVEYTADNGEAAE